MLKVGNKMMGENPEEQLKLERKRFDKRQLERDAEVSKKRQELEEMGNRKGQTKLF